MPSTCRRLQNGLTDIVAESYNWRIGSCLQNVSGSSEHAPGFFIVFAVKTHLVFSAHTSKDVRDG